MNPVRATIFQEIDYSDTKHRTQWQEQHFLSPSSQNCDRPNSAAQSSSTPKSDRPNAALPIFTTHKGDQPRRRSLLGRDPDRQVIPIAAVTDHVHQDMRDHDGSGALTTSLFQEIDKHHYGGQQASGQSHSDPNVHLVDQLHQNMKEHLGDSMRWLLEQIRGLHHQHTASPQIDHIQVVPKGFQVLEAKRFPQRTENSAPGLIDDTLEVDSVGSSDDLHASDRHVLQLETSRNSMTWEQNDTSNLVRSKSHDPMCAVLSIGNAEAGLKQDFKTSDVSFELLDVWKQESTKNVGGSNSLLNNHVRTTRHAEQEKHGFEPLMKRTSAPQTIASILGDKIILDPSSKTRFTWDILSTILVTYDIVWLPLLLLDPPEISLTAAISWCSRLFWTADIAMSLITGYMTPQGFIDFRPSRIAERYFKSWFALDVLVVSTDWLEILFETAKVGGFARIGRTSRIIRLLRMVRLLRVLRVQKSMMGLLENLRSEWIKELSVLFKILIVLCASGHFCACIWYSIGSSSEEEHTWVKTHFVAKHDLGYRYATSLHWSLSQFSGGLDSIQPENLPERCYAVGTWIYAFMIGAIMVSALTSSWTQLNILAKNKTMKMTTLRKYLTDNNIPDMLSNRVQRNAQMALDEMERRKPESSVELLQLVSTPLRMALHFELYYRTMEHHPFLQRCGQVHCRVMQKICHFATSTMSICQGDIIFNWGEIPTNPNMVFVQTGHLSYFNAAQLARMSANPRHSLNSATTVVSITSDGSFTSPVPSEHSDSSAHRLDHSEADHTKLSPGEWCAEPFLWTHWMCRGLLSASNDAQLVLLNAHKFQEIVSAYHECHYDDKFNPKLYAVEFLTGLQAMGAELSDITVGIEMKAMANFSRVRRAVHRGIARK